MKQLRVLIFALVMPSTFVLGQEGDLASRIASLERQRDLQARIAHARDSGDLREAARLTASLAGLPFLVALPFTEDVPDLRAAIKKAARELLEQEVATIRKELISEQEQALGRVCNRCDGRAFVQCRHCRGRGYRDRRIGRRTRRIECRAWDGCGSCDESGRRAPNPDVQSRLQALARLTGKEAARVDVMVSLKNVIKAVGGLPAGAKIEDPRGAALRKLTGSVLFDPDRLAAGVKTRIKKAWLASAPEERREYLFQLSLDVGRVVRGLRYLAAVKGETSVKKLVKEAKPTTLEELAWNGRAWAGRAVVIEAIGASPTKQYLDAVDFPLSGRIRLKGVDPNLVLAFCYTPDDLTLIRACARMGITPRADRAIRGYPPRSVPKALEKIGPGRLVRFFGRVLPHPDGVPAALLEVWHVEEVSSDDDGGR